MSNSFFSTPLYSGMARSADDDHRASAVVRRLSNPNRLTTRDDCVRLQQDLRRLVDGPTDSRRDPSATHGEPS